jgi:succinate dehydrogenase / fumarate reductase membrane anchor subunit
MTPITAKAQGVWAWIGQRITAVLLVVFLGTHIFVLHYVPENLNINFVGVAFRFKSLLYVIIDSGLLATGLYHGLNGVRNVLFDFVLNEGTRRLINWVLWLVGGALTLWGAYALTFFMK